MVLSLTISLAIGPILFIEFLSFSSLKVLLPRFNEAENPYLNPAHNTVLAGGLQSVSRTFIPNTRLQKSQSQDCEQFANQSLLRARFSQIHNATELLLHLMAL
jgi:hypothetical protein